MIVQLEGTASGPTPAQRRAAAAALAALGADPVFDAARGHLAGVAGWERDPSVRSDRDLLAPLEPRQAPGPGGASGEAEDGLSKAEEMFLTLLDGDRRLSKSEGITPGERARARDEQRTARQALGHELAMRRSEGYREVQRTRALGGSLS